jgi:Mrp family chromosome partitioning ATPase
VTAIILAAPDVLAEPSLVAAATPAGLKVLRRCVDASDLLACAAAEPATAVVLSAGVPRLSGDLVARMEPSRRPVVALVANDDDEAKVRAWGIEFVVRLGEAGATATAIAEVLSGSAHRRAEMHQTARIDASGLGGGELNSGVLPSGALRTRALQTPVLETGALETGARDPGVFDTGVWSQADGRCGLIVAVWGPRGAPGRTSTAIGLAEGFIRAGQRVLLADADTHAASIAVMLGIVDDASGLIVACRHADNGTLSARTLQACARAIGPGLSVLTGIPRPDRWPDAREAALEQVWRICRSAFDVTVIDVGSDIDDDAHGSVNPVLASRRNASALTALAQCDVVLSVGRADALGLSRLAHSYSTLSTAAGKAGRAVGIVTQERGPASWRQVRMALTGIGIEDPVVRIEAAPRRGHRRLARGLLPSESGISRRERAGYGALVQLLLRQAGSPGHG